MLEINAWCCLLHNKVMESFFFADAKFSGNIYLGMLENVAFLAAGRRRRLIYFLRNRNTTSDNTLLQIHSKRGVLGLAFGGASNITKFDAQRLLLT
jgi:hypothetical protein